MTNADDKWLPSAARRRFGLRTDGRCGTQKVTSFRYFRGLCAKVLVLCFRQHANARAAAVALAGQLRFWSALPPSPAVAMGLQATGCGLHVPRKYGTRSH